MLHAAERAALAEIRATYDSLDRWRERSRHLEEPQPGSELADDATIWPGSPPHQVARTALVSGVQHLNLARAAIEQGQLFPIAHSTALRGALLGAARGVWLLESDERTERQQRGLRIVHETYRRHRQFAQAAAFTSAAPPSIRGLADLLGALAREVRELWASTSTLSASSVPSETDVITAAASAAFTNPDHQAAIALLWMQLSGDAHALPWAVLTRESTTTTHRGRRPGFPQPMSELEARGDLAEVADAFKASHTLLRRGWSLYDQRAEAH